MSDEIYAQQLKRRQKRLQLIGGGVILVLLLAFLIRSIYYDNCTNGFDRAPLTVIQSYAQSVAKNNTSAAMACWQREAYYSLETGCSEICLQHLWGNQFTVQDIQIGEIQTLENGRNQIQVTVLASCPDGKTQESAQILLDTASIKLPWAHWKIIQSNYGGSIGEPWCKVTQ